MYQETSARTLAAPPTTQSRAAMETEPTQINSAGAHGTGMSPPQGNC